MPNITMPQLGETVTEGTVTRWLKQVGEHVEIDEPLLDVSTDKVDTEIPSGHAGTLTRIVVAAGDTVPIGTVLCVIGDADTAPDGTEDGGTDTAAGAAARVDLRRRLVGHQANLGAPPQIVTPTPGSRRSGFVTAGDEPIGAATDRHDATHPRRPPDLPDLAVRAREPFSTVRRRTAKHLRASLSTAAHTLTTTEVDYAAIETWRSADALSFLPFVASATCRALARFPRMNASVGDDELVLWAPINLGIAVDLDYEGLVVPVIADADTMRVRALARRIRELSAAARGGELGADAFAGGTFTITNAGRYGTVVTGPVINTPQVGILSVDGIGARPVAVADGDGWAVAVRLVGNLSLSFDHRAVDGACATAFLAHVRELLEETDWSAELGE